MTTATLRERLRAGGFRGEILAEEPLADHTTWQIGGPAEVLATPADRDDLLAAVGWARQADVPWRVLGNGSNLLVADAGVRGLVIRIKKTLDHIEVDEPLIEAGAGASFPAVANLAATWGLSGLEFAAGIPGTVGGAVVMNAGWHEFEVRQVIHRVDVLDTGGDVRPLTPDDCRFAYRTSRFRNSTTVILSVVFRLRPSEAGRVRREMEKYAVSRQQNQPTSLPSCGSVYLKPPGDFAGRLIDETGLKGRRRGGIEVCRQHANFFVNHGDATCADALALMEEVETAVLDRFGVRLTREVEHWQ